MLPPFPVVASPVKIAIFPVEPFELVPVAIEIAPEIPSSPAFDVAITTCPLELPILYPVFKETEPPVPAAA